MFFCCYYVRSTWTRALTVWVYFVSTGWVIETFWIKRNTHMQSIPCAGMQTHDSRVKNEAFGSTQVFSSTIVYYTSNMIPFQSNWIEAQLLEIDHWWGQSFQPYNSRLKWYKLGCSLYFLLEHFLHGITHANCYDGWGYIKRYIHVCRLLCSPIFSIYIWELVQSLSLSPSIYISFSTDLALIRFCWWLRLSLQCRTDSIGNTSSFPLCLVCRYYVRMCVWWVRAVHYWMENWNLPYAWQIWNQNGTIKVLVRYFSRDIRFALIWYTRWY